MKKKEKSPRIPWESSLVSESVLGTAVTRCALAFNTYADRFFLDAGLLLR